jgi:thiol:disulfide interchange protein DsbD
VLTLQIGAEGALKVECGLLLLMFSVWARRRLGGRMGQGIAVLSLLLAIAACWVGGRSEPAGAGIAAGGAWKPYAESAVSEAVASGKPVFVDFTAAWCLTCQVNKKLVLDRSGVQEYFRAKGVELFLADWTNRDPAITKALEKQARLGVPLYLAYRAGNPVPEVLPQLLTEERIRATFP